MLCEKCHQREATVHTTTIVGDDVTTVNRCAECSEGAAPDLASMVQAGCHYCGGAFYCSAPDLSGQSCANPKLWALCKRCAEEFYGFCSRTLPGFGTEAFTQEQFSKVPAMLTKLDRHMKQWVSERDSQ
jgi:protein-arginine kinase activator protein McsA